MSKEIKFRAWDENWNAMYQNFQFIKSGNDGNDWIVFIADNIPFNSNWKENPFFKKQLKIMEYVGKKDFNGKEIYTGDILSDRWKVEVYQNDDGTFMVKFHTNPKSNKPLTLNSYLLKREKAGTSICEGNRDCIVIGNIYQNSKLLQGIQK